MAAAAPVSGRAPRPAGCRGKNGPSSAASEIAALHPCPRGGGRLRVFGDRDGALNRLEPLGVEEHHALSWAEFAVRGS
jgi:hypothetical protein